MRRWWSDSLSVLAVIAVLSACGSTVGDACTTEDDCGGQICLNRGSGTPGGYCSEPCSLTEPDSCPSGSICIPNGAGENLHACFRTCGSTSDCRRGYQCIRVRDQQQTVCAGHQDL